MAVLPELEANFALTWDGKITTHRRAPTGFTSPRDKRRLLEIRARADALVVGRTTLITDNMGMGLAAPDLREERWRQGLPAEPLRVIVSGRGRLSRNLKVFRTSGAPLVVFTTEAMPVSTRRWLETIADLRVARGEIRPRKILEVLGKDYGARRVLCEGGASLLRSFVQAGLLSRLHVTLAPLVFGGAEAPTLLGPARDGVLPSSVKLRLAKLQRAGDEMLATYEVVRSVRLRRIR